MPEKTKITLSDKELSLVKNAGWILTKQMIIQKVYDLFGDRVSAIKLQFNNNNLLPENLRLSIPKITKGENYRQLPYVILDYPAYFEKENVFTVRTMFWWGNFFSITLQVSGRYKMLLRETNTAAWQASAADLYISVNEDQWEHHFEEDNFLPFTKFSVQQRTELFEANNFIKLAMKFPLDEWNKMPELLDAGYKKMAAVLFNYPGDEKDL